MEKFSMEFTVAEWRIIAASLTMSRVIGNDRRLQARQMAYKIADQTGRYDSEGNKHDV